MIKVFVIPKELVQQLAGVIPFKNVEKYILACQIRDSIIIIIEVEYSNSIPCNNKSFELDFLSDHQLELIRNIQLATSEESKDIVYQELIQSFS